VGKTGAREPPSGLSISRAQRTRNKGANGNRKADVYGDRKEQNLRRKADGTVSFGSPSLDTQSRDNRSTTNIAMSPTEVAAVMTITWRIVEPSVKTARGLIPIFVD
jgi:hypothetical protein